jgi:type II secretory pathway component PulF
LELGSELAGSKKSQVLASTLLNDIKKGSSFSQALDSIGPSFPAVYKGLVSVGERSGSLQSILKELTNFLKSNKGFWSKIISALLYPALLLLALSGVMIYFVFEMLPQFVQGISANNPDAAVQLQQTADFLIIGAAVFLSLILLLSFSILFYQYSKSKNSDYAKFFEQIFLRIPLVSRLIVLREMITYHFALKTLSSGGVPLEESLDISKNSMSLVIFRGAIDDVRQEIIGGSSLSQSYASQKVFPKEMIKWARIGEETGDVSTVFSQLKEYYQEEMDIKTQRISDLAFPVFIIFVGIILGLVVANVILPLLNSLQTVN